MAERSLLVPAAPQRLRALVVLNSFGLYGLERNVIETFAGLRSFIEPVLLIPRAAVRYNPRLMSELRTHGFTLQFFSDHTDWPRIQKPRSLQHAWQIATALSRGNRDVWKAAEGCDLIYVPILTGLYFSFLASFWFRMRGRRVLFSFQDLAWRPSQWLRLGAVWVTGFVHLSKRSAEIAIAANPFIARRDNHIIPPIIELSRPGVRDSASPRPNSGRIVLFVGQVAKHKGIDVLLEAFCRIAPKFPDAELHIVGGADWEYGANFQHVLESTGLGARICHWGYRSDVQALFKVSYVYVHPSLPSMFHESFGRSAAEAMSAGVPIVCFRSGALCDIVEHDSTGLICEEESARCLASNLELILSDSQRRERYSQQSLERFKEKYSKETIRRQWRSELRIAPEK